MPDAFKGAAIVLLDHLFEPFPHRVYNSGYPLLKWFEVQGLDHILPTSAIGLPESVEPLREAGKLLLL